MRAHSPDKGRHARLFATPGMAALACACVSLPSTGALAQTALNAPAAPAANASDAGNAVETVVVTAQFRSQKLQDTPIAITAITGDMLEQRGQTSAVEVANEAPNVTLKPAPASFGSAMQASIRGVGQTDFNFAYSPGVGIYVDDVYYSTLTGSLLDLLDLDRVEVLRGPQGTLSGANTIGGAVKLYSKKPNGDGGGYLQATYGSYNEVGFRGAVDFAIVPDKLFVRISGASEHQTGYVTRIDYACANPGSGLPTITLNSDCKLGTSGGTSYNAIRASFRWLPTANVEVNLVADVVRDNSESGATVLLYANDPTKSLNGVPYDSRFVPSQRYVSYATFTDVDNPYGAYSVPPENTLNAMGVSNTIDWTILDGMSVKSITSYRYYNNAFADDGDVSPENLNLFYNRLTNNQFTQELRLNGQFGQAIDYTIGGFYLKDHGVMGGRINSPPINFVQDDPVNTENKAVYATAVWHVTDKLNLTGGVRYTTESKDYTFYREAPDFSGPAGVVGSISGFEGGSNDSHVDYRVDADYRWTPNIMTYAEFSTGFKGGGINPRPFVPTQVQPFGPEQLDAYEVGFKGLFFDHRLRLNAAAFYNQYKDIQLILLSCPQFSPTPSTPCSLPVNGGDATVKGAELEAEAHPVAGLELDGSVSYLDFKYDSVIAGAGLTLGMVSPDTPKWKWNLGAQYSIPVGNAGSITPRLDVTYQSDMYADAVNGPNNLIQSSTLLNGRITWRAAGSPWEAALLVTNITDKYYFYQKFDNNDGGKIINGQVAPPREWSVTVTRRF